MKYSTHWVVCWFFGFFIQWVFGSDNSDGNKINFVPTLFTISNSQQCSTGKQQQRQKKHRFKWMFVLWIEKRFVWLRMFLIWNCSERISNNSILCVCLMFVCKLKSKDSQRKPKRCERMKIFMQYFLIPIIAFECNNKFKRFVAPCCDRNRNTKWCVVWKCSEIINDSI